MEWWGHQSFVDKSKIKIADVIAVETLRPYIRANYQVTDVVVDQDFRKEMITLFRREPCGTLNIADLGKALSHKGNKTQDQINGQDQIAELIKLLGHDQKSVRQKSSHDLVSIGLAAIPELEIALQHDNQAIRDNATNALKKLKERKLRIWVKKELD